MAAVGPATAHLNCERVPQLWLALRTRLLLVYCTTQHEEALPPVHSPSLFTSTRPSCPPILSPLQPLLFDLGAYAAQVH